MLPLIQLREILNKLQEPHVYPELIFRPPVATLRLMFWL